MSLEDEHRRAEKMLACVGYLGDTLDHKVFRALIDLGSPDVAHAARMAVEPGAPYRDEKCSHAAKDSAAHIRRIIIDLALKAQDGDMASYGQLHGIEGALEGALEVTLLKLERNVAGDQ